MARTSYDRSSSVTLEDVGFTARAGADATRSRWTRRRPPPTARRWATRGRAPSRTGTSAPSSSFGAGHGVWESSGGPTLPFYARNLAHGDRSGCAPLAARRADARRARAPGEVVHAEPARRAGRRAPPHARGRHHPVLRPRPERPSSRRAAPGWSGRRLKDGRALPRTPAADGARGSRSSVVQVTNLGLTVKDSPLNTLVLVTRLDTGAPVEGAQVAIRKLRQHGLLERLHGRGRPGRGPAHRPARRPSACWELRFLVTAEKDGDTAYVGSDWNEGIEPWNFGLRLRPHGGAARCCAASVFADRGVYRLGEEVHLKAILRSDTAEGIRAARHGHGGGGGAARQPGRGAWTSARSRCREWSSADWTLTPARRGAPRLLRRARDGGGPAAARSPAVVPRRRLPPARLPRGREPGGGELAGGRLAQGCRHRPLPLRRAHGRPRRALDVLALRARHRAGARSPTRSRRSATPSSTRNARTVRTARPETLLAARGQARCAGPARAGPRHRPGRGPPVPVPRSKARSPTSRARGSPAARPSAWIPRPGTSACGGPAYFADVKTGVDTEVVAVDLAGRPVAGVAVDVVLTQVQWHSRAPGGGPGLLHLGDGAQGDGGGPLDGHDHRHPGAVARARARAAATSSCGRPRRTRRAAPRPARRRFYVLGPGYTAWERYDHNRIDLLPEKKTYRPGETARLMIKSPWESALALLTTEREGVRTHRTLRLTLHPGDGDGAHRRAGHPERLRLGGPGEGPQRRLHAGGHGRSRQAGLPCRLRGAEGRGQRRSVST